MRLSPWLRRTPATRVFKSFLGFLFAVIAAVGFTAMAAPNETLTLLIGLRAFASDSLIAQQHGSSTFTGVAQPRFSGSTYYYKGSGSLAAASSWNTFRNGLGSNATSFSGGDSFVIQTGQNPTLNTGLTISGAGSSLTVENGAAFSDGGNNPSATLILQSGATYTSTSSSYSNISSSSVMDSNSTFTYGGPNSSAFVDRNYGNFVWQLAIASTATTAADVHTSANFTVDSGATLNVATSTVARTWTIGGNLIVNQGNTLNLTNGTANGTAVNVSGALVNNGSITKTGSGSMTLSFTGSGSSNATWGTNSGNFAVTIGSGKTIRFTDTLSSTGTVTVNGTLGGSGIAVGPVNVSAGGTIAPGSSAGKLSTGSVSFASTSNFNVEIGGTTAGTDYDQLKVSGTVAINGASLATSSSGAAIPAGTQTYKIIDNDGTSDAVSGTLFTGLGEGAVISTDFLGTHRTATISYVGGDGNDVVITVAPSVAVPTSPTFSQSTPASPNNSSTTPTINGSADSTATSVDLYTNSNCSGSAAYTATLVNGRLAVGGAFAIPVTVTANSSTTFSAIASNAGGGSACSATPFTYVHDTVAPNAPSNLGSSPSSPNPSTSPSITGDSEAGSTVKIYLGSSCGGSLKGTGTAIGGTFSIAISGLVSNSVNVLSAQATDAAGNVSACSAEYDYYAYAAPTVSGISPNSGPTGGGTVVTVSGANFAVASGQTTVKIGGVTCTGVNVSNGGSLTCTTGAHSAPGAVSVDVTTPGGTNTPSNSLFTYVASPTATNLSAAETYTEDTALDLIDIVVSDQDSSDVTVTLTLSDPLAGGLSTATSGSVTSTYVAASGVWTAQGPIADVNVLLAGVTFTPSADYNSNFSIATSVTDGVTAAITGTKIMTGVAVNDAPVLDASKSPTLNSESEDSGTPIGVVGTPVSSLVDYATPSGQVDNVTDSDGPALGIALVGADVSHGTWYYSTNNGSSWSAVGSVSDTSALLLSANGANRLYLQPNPDFSGTINSAITFRAWDQSTGTNGARSSTTPNGGSTAFSSVTDTASLIVTGVNDAPVLDASKSPALSSENEDAGTPSGVVGTLVSNLVDLTPPAGGLDNVTDSDGPGLGIAIVGTDTSHGTWYYSTDNGSSWSAVGSVSDTSALLLSANGANRLYFEPNADFNGTINSAITFRAWDQSTGTNGARSSTTPNGGSTAFSSVTDTASLIVTGVNDAPVLDASKTPVLNSENENAGSPSGTVGTPISNLVDLTPPAGGLDNVTDVDGPGLGIAIMDTDATNGTWYFTLNNGSTWTALGSVSGTSARLLSTSSNNRLYFKPNTNFSGVITAAIQFRAWDQSTGTDGATADVTSNGGTTAFSSAVDSASLTINASAGQPTVSGVSPGYGPDTGGTVVTISGSNFSTNAGETTVAIGGATCSSVSVTNSSSLTCSTGAHTAGTVDVIVHTSGGGDSNTSANARFTYTLSTCNPSTEIYVDDDWAGTIPGTDPDGAGPATNFGCDSFSDIQSGIDGAPASGGTVHIKTGTYTGSLDTTARSINVSPGSSPGQVTLTGNMIL
ncbi:MAG: IPT/TIG domain-containing protein, partial [Acidobacteria bacterium]|nr:IPT/TIG domain-containing protein [Acidobacteriota bacterium]